jgi:hypothetical protein
MTGHLLNVQCLQVSYSFFFDANALKLVVTFLAPLVIVDQTQTQILRKGFMNKYLRILFVLLIERNNVGSEQVQVH